MVRRPADWQPDSRPARLSRLTCGGCSNIDSNRRSPFWFGCSVTLTPLATEVDVSAWRFEKFRHLPSRSRRKRPNPAKRCRRQFFTILTSMRRFGHDDRNLRESAKSPYSNFNTRERLLSVVANPPRPATPDADEFTSSAHRTTVLCHLKTCFGHTERAIRTLAQVDGSHHIEWAKGLHLCGWPADMGRMARNPCSCVLPHYGSSF